MIKRSTAKHFNKKAGSRNRFEMTLCIAEYLIRRALSVISAYGCKERTKIIFVKKQRTRRHVKFLTIVLKNKYVKSSNNWVRVDMELKSGKNILCLVVVGLLELRTPGKTDVTGAERREVFGDLRLSHFLQSGEKESQCG